LDSANNRLFVGLSDRSRTVVYNISNPINPVEIWRGEGLFGGADFSARRLVTSPSDGMFIVWDISGATPNRLGEHGIALQPVVAALKDNYIVTNSKNGLVVFNVANPSQPQLVKHLPLQGFQRSSGRLVFDGDVGIYSHSVVNTNNLFFLNFADPTSPQLLQSYSHNYGIFALAVIGDYLYVGRGGGRDIYSISSRARLSSQTGNTILAMAAKVDPNIAGSVLYEAYQTGLSTSALQHSEKTLLRELRDPARLNDQVDNCINGRVRHFLKQILVSLQDRVFGVTIVYPQFLQHTFDETEAVSFQSINYRFYGIRKFVTVGFQRFPNHIPKTRIEVLLNLFNGFIVQSSVFSQGIVYESFNYIKVTLAEWRSIFFFGNLLQLIPKRLACGFGQLDAFTDSFPY
jgi:hypothetical protein